jgi:uncharacterized protein YqgC (DUF456 family)
MPDFLIWFLSITLILIGLLGCIVPGIPGAPLILLGALAHKLGIPDQLRWWTIFFLCVVTLLSSGLNILITGYTAQKAGASRLAAAAAVFGAVVALFMSFLWLFLLPLLLAFAVEFVIKRKKATTAAAISAKVGFGLFISAFLQLILALIMVIALVIDWVWI